MSEELWYVKLANGDVHRVTLDQLDGAFQAGHIDEGTMVLAAGASTWTKLGDLAGLDDESGEAGAEDGSSESDDSWDIPAHIAAAPVEYVAPPTRTMTPPTQAAHDAAYAAPAYAAPAYAHAPAAYVAPRTPIAVSMPPAARPTYAPSSLRPMSVDLGEMDLDVPFKRKSRKGFVVAVLGLAAIAGGVGFAAQRAHIGQGSDDIAHVAAAAAMIAPPPSPEPVVDPTPAPAAAPAALAAAVTPPSPNTAPTGASPLNPQFTTTLNEGTKQKLLAADKAHEAKSKARHSGGGGSAHRSSSKPKSTTFTTGGNKFDPLNSAI
ncbi:MAG TPA: hypothetical protein VH044_02045 [Polyangiaceae bacterium]|jgi:hypothetical protein|nr:hypothetical protein [Polyangiaceae bacterium]